LGGGRKEGILVEPEKKRNLMMDSARIESVGVSPGDWTAIGQEKKGGLNKGRSSVRERLF